MAANHASLTDATLASAAAGRTAPARMIVSLRAQLAAAPDSGCTLLSGDADLLGDLLAELLERRAGDGDGRSPAPPTPTLMELIAAREALERRMVGFEGDTRHAAAGQAELISDEIARRVARLGAGAVK